MVRACSTHREKRTAYRILSESQKERGHLEDQDVGGRIILKLIREIGWGDMDRIDLTQDRDQWRVLVNTIMNPQVA
jgi:hypothetical protein